MSPKDFMALADFTGVMLSVGPWVLETACRQAREWQRRGSRGLRLMVNLSAHELQQDDLVVHVEKALAASGLSPDSLHLEIPEGYAMQDLARTIETLRALRSVGVHLAIDGFGTGFTSLAHLRQLPVDTLEDRPVLRARGDHRRGRRLGRDRGDRGGPQPGPARRGPGRRDRGAGGAAALAGLRRGPGLPVEPAGPARGVRADPGPGHAPGGRRRRAGTTRAGRAARGAAPGAESGPQGCCGAASSSHAEPSA